MFKHIDLEMKKYLKKKNDCYIAFLNGKLFGFSKENKVDNNQSMTNVYLDKINHNKIVYIIYLFSCNSSPSNAFSTYINVFIPNNVKVKIIEEFKYVEKKFLIKNSSYSLTMHLNKFSSCAHYSDINVKNINLNYKYLLKQNSNLFSFSFLDNISGKYELSADLLENNAVIENKSLFVLTEKNKIDCSVDVNHFSNNCFSNQIIKSSLFDESKFIFKGRIFGDKNIKNSKAKQFNNNFVLSKSAISISRPNLLVYSQGLEVSHGATIYPIDEDVVFYLMARGFTKKIAICFLFYGFCIDIINTIELELIKKIYICGVKQYAQKISENKG